MTRQGGGEVGVLVLVVMGLFLLLGGISTCCYIQPQYNVWAQQKAGEAELAKAESTRKVAILEAQAKRDSAEMLAEAEVKRAEGVARANQIIGDSLKGNDAYLRYLWIQGLENGTNQHQVIYVPTEANLPILEAGRAVQRPEKP